jgi:hypothetical protein
MEKSNLEPASSPPNLEQIYNLVQSLENSIAQQKQEFMEQKQQLESKIAHLEEALKEKANLAPEPQTIPQEITSRRRMLKKLGGAAAGMAAATTLMVTTNTQNTQAAVGNLLFQGAAGDPNVVTSTTKIIAGPAPSSYSNTSILELSITNPSSNGVVDGIQSSSALGVGLIGQSNLATKAGVIGTNGNLTPSGLTSVVSTDIGGVSGGSDSASGRGVTGYVTGSAAAVGVFGKATGSSGIGVLGTSTGGLGGSFATGASSTRGQLLLQAGTNSVANLTGNALGEMYVDSAGRFYIYENSAGTGAAWKLFGTSNPSGVIKLLPKPSRFVDTRALYKRNDNGGPYGNTTARTYNMLSLTGSGGVTLPPNATGVVGNIT